ncbi:MAG: AraC family transcriptional regulator [Victivallales bacterium]
MDKFVIEVGKLPRLTSFYLPVRVVGYQPNDIGAMNKRVMHPGINFVFILSGSRKTRIDGYEYQMSAPGLLIERPGIVHEAKDETPFEIMYLAYDIKHAESMKCFFPEPFTPFSKLDLSVELWAQVNQLAELCASARIPGTADRIDRLAESLVAEAAIYMKTRAEAADSLRNAIYEAASYIEFHYMDDIDIGWLIKRGGFSKRTFLRRWEEIFKQPPGQFMSGLKVRDARRMLKSSNLQISEIAARLNFSDAFYFSRMFKKREGMSPSEYRKETLNKLLEH